MQRHLRTYRMLTKARHKNSLSLYKIQKQAKLINGISSQHSGYLWREGRVLEERHREASGWWQHSLLTWVVYSFCNDSWGCIHFWSVHFSICILHLAYKFKKKTASVTTDHYLDTTWTWWKSQLSYWQLEVGTLVSKILCAGKRTDQKPGNRGSGLRAVTLSLHVSGSWIPRGRPLSRCWKWRPPKVPPSSKR